MCKARKESFYLYSCMRCTYWFQCLRLISCSIQEIQTHKLSSNIHVGGKDVFALRHPSLDKAKIIDASLILKDPHRSNRPDHIVLILRGLPGLSPSFPESIGISLEQWCWHMQKISVIKKNWMHWLWSPYFLVLLSYSSWLHFVNWNNILT